MRLRILLFLLYFVAELIIAQVNFNVAIHQKNIAVEDVFKIDFIVDREVEKFTAPSFGDFEIIGKPEQEIRRSWNNGKREFSRIYSFSLKPKKLGKVMIHPAKVNFGSKNYNTKPIALNIISLEDKVKKEMTAFWSNNDGSKLILVDKNFEKQFDQEKINFFLLKKGQVKKVDNKEVLPRIALKDAIKIDELKNIKYDLSTVWYLYYEYNFIKLKKAKSNEKLVFEIDYNIEGFEDEELNESINFLKKYTNKTLVYKYEAEKFLLLE